MVCVQKMACQNGVQERARRPNHAAARGRHDVANEIVNAAPPRVNGFLSPLRAASGQREGWMPDLPLTDAGSRR